MNISFFACFHAISPERSGFSKIATFFSCPCVACSARIVADKQTHRTTTVTLAAHARRGLIKGFVIIM